MTLSRKKYLLFAAIAVAMSVAGMLVILLVADLVLHRRAERSAGLNRYGYRGPVVGRKQPGELRVVMLGGSTVFGYGVSWNESVPALLEARLREKSGGRPISVVNLGFNNEGAYAFVPNLEDFSYLQYDVVVLYEGYNDLAGDNGVNSGVFRRDSAIYRLFGYYPILPIYLQEKAMALRYGNDLNAAYRDLGRKSDDPSAVVFKPGLATRTSAAAIDAIGAMTQALDGRFERTRTKPATAEHESTLGCASPDVTYCESVAAAIRFSLARGLGVVVGSQPRLPGRRSPEFHARQQQSVTAMIARIFGSEKRVVFADLSHALDLNDPNITFDGMHLNPPGNRTIADALMPYVEAVATK